MTTKKNPDFDYLHKWEKQLLAYGGELPTGIRKATLIAYCFTMASHGRAGKDCFASDTLIMRELGISNRAVIAGYRKAAIALGWFTPVSKVRRAVHLQVSIPNVPVAETFGEGGSNVAVSATIENGPNVAVSATLPRVSSKEDTYQERVFKCNRPGCNIPAGLWHEHMPDT